MSNKYIRERALTLALNRLGDDEAPIVEVLALAERLATWLAGGPPGPSGPASSPDTGPTAGHSSAAAPPKSDERAVWHDPDCSDASFIIVNDRVHHVLWHPRTRATATPSAWCGASPEFDRASLQEGFAAGLRYAAAHDPGPRTPSLGPAQAPGAPEADARISAPAPSSLHAGPSSSRARESSSLSVGCVATPTVEAGGEAVMASPPRDWTEAA